MGRWHGLSRQTGARALTLAQILRQALLSACWHFAPALVHVPPTPARASDRCTTGAFRVICYNSDGLGAGKILVLP